MTPRHPRRGAAVALAATVAIAASALAAPAVAAPAPAAKAPVVDGPAEINGFRSVGYFQAHAPNPEGRNYQVADIIRSGAIDDLTHINYSFGNVTTDLVCDIVDVEGEGDPENDFTRTVSAKDSVDGKADKKNQKLAGNFNQLKKLKKVSPDTKIMISLGGWTWSDNFSDAASTEAGRKKLVKSCVDLYIKGNLPEIDGKGGKGVAKGIFDGIDIDWEWPAADGEQPSPRPAEDKANFLALLQEFRTQLDAYGAKTGEDYLLSGFAPAGWAPRTNGGWVDPIAVEAFDYINVQGYDYHGGWVGNRTGHQGNLHVYDWPVDPTAPDGAQTQANWGLAADGLMNAYKAAGYSGDQLNLGMAMYGQGWEGVSDAKPGSAATASIGTPTYKELRNAGTEYYDEVAGAGYIYDGDKWYSLDTVRSVTAKAEWLATNGFGGAMWWDISGDYENELGDAVGSTFRAATPGPAVADNCAAPWYGTGIYSGKDVVSFEGDEYAAQWWTRDQKPGDVNGPWKKIGPCGTAPAVDADQCAPAWDAAATYSGGDKVSRAGVNHTARWWTRGEQPGTNPTGAWAAGQPCTTA
ncbi:chitinase [Sediminihabitans luteus]|uniref:chitinase n=1 Tax=Sediminihabitans luteus TaxID=1138585 RepID=A0A2M9CEQ8_9CELL|nr:glycosyl hydrolase family 18 protein [Sediminihabitans luteus]PJJ70369.1 chitinase [Sediminihabitans luteus]GII97841.1 hypothetical protein Slu03_02190 [Sediminihabitans luteus]